MAGKCGGELIILLDLTGAVRRGSRTSSYPVCEHSDQWRVAGTNARATPFGFAVRLVPSTLNDSTMPTIAPGNPSSGVTVTAVSRIGGLCWRPTGPLASALANPQFAPASLYLAPTDPLLTVKEYPRSAPVLCYRSDSFPAASAARPLRRNNGVPRISVCA